MTPEEELAAFEAAAQEGPEPAKAAPQEKPKVEGEPLVVRRKARSRNIADMAPVTHAIVKAAKQMGLSEQQISDLFAEANVSQASVHKILQQRGKKAALPADVDKVREEFAKTASEILHKLMLSANSEEYAEMLAKVRTDALPRAINTIAQTFNSMSGKPTEVIEIRDATEKVFAKLRELDELEKQLKIDLKVI